jgi:hypothetical protein
MPGALMAGCGPVEVPTGWGVVSAAGSASVTGRAQVTQKRAAWSSSSPQKRHSASGRVCLPRASVGLRFTGRAQKMQ